jgi:hypothetical protein
VFRLKASLLIVLALLSGCHWFHRGKPATPNRPELVVTGIPPGAFVYVDGVQVGDAQEKSYRSRIIDVAPGMHIVEVKMGDTVTYRENAYAGPGDRRTITVLSGNSRN